MAVTINVQASQTALAQSIAQGVAAYNAKFASQNQLNLGIDPKTFSQPLGRITGDLKQFESALAASNARVLAFGASTAVIGGVAKSFKDLAASTIEVEKALVDINRVLALSSSGLQKFSSDLFGVAKATASSFQDASEAALEFSRQGLSTEQTLQRVADALTLVRLTGVSAKQAVEDLTAVTNAYAQTSLDTTTILNKIVAVEQAFAVSAADLTSAVSRTGQAAQEAGVNFDQLNALVTSAQEKTARGGAVIGNALKTIFTRLQRPETLTQLENFNIAVRDIEGNVLPAVQILQNLAASYNSLADTSRSALAEQVAGVYQVNILKSILSDLNDQQGDYNKALSIGAKATNEAQQANAALNITLAALISQTGTNLQQLSSNIGKVTFEPVFKNLISPFNDAITYINQILEGEGLGSEFAGGLLKGIKNVLGGPVLFGTVAIITKVIGNTFKDITTAIPTLLGITTQSQKRKDVETAILDILQSQSQVSMALQGEQGNLINQQRILLDLAANQTARYQQQLNIAKQLSAVLVGKNIQVGSAGLQVGNIKAAGYIPTYGSGYVPNNARRAEIAGAISGGYKPGTVIPSPVGGVMNTAETIKYVPGFAQPFINPPEYSRAGIAHKSTAIRETGVNPYRATGYIPNFGIGGFKAWLRGKPGGSNFLDKADLSDINWYRQNPQLVGQLQTYLSQYQVETKDQYSPAILNNFLKQTERGYTGSAISAETGRSTFTAEKQFKAVPETPSVKPQIKAASVVARFKSSKSFEAAYPDLLNIVNDPNISQEERDKAQNVLKQSFGKAYEDFALKELKKMGFGGAVTAESIGLYGSGYGQTAVDAVDFGTKTFFEFKGGEVENKNINEKFDRVRTDPGNFDVLTKKVWKNVLVSNEYNQGAKSGNKVIYINPVDQVDPQLYLKEGLGTATKSFGPQAIKDVRREIIKEAKRVTQFNLAEGFIPNFANPINIGPTTAKRLGQFALNKADAQDTFQANIIPEYLSKTVEQYREQALAELDKIYISTTKRKKGEPAYDQAALNRFKNKYKSQANKAYLDRVITNIQNIGAYGTKSSGFDTALFQLQGMLGEVDARKQTGGKFLEGFQFFDLLDSQGGLVEVRTTKKVKANDIFIKGVNDKLKNNNYKNNNKIDDVPLGNLKVLLPKESPIYSGGFIPNFAKNWVYDSDVFTGGYAGKFENLKKFILDNPKLIKDILIAPAGAGKTTYAQKKGYATITDFSQISDGDRVLLLSGSNLTKKGGISSYLSDQIKAVNQTGGNKWFGEVSNETIQARRLQRETTTGVTRGKGAPLREPGLEKILMDLGFTGMSLASNGFIPNFANKNVMPIWMHPDAGIFQDAEAADHNELKEIFKGKIPRDSLRGYVQGNSVTLDAPLNFLYRNDKNIKQKIEKINALIKSKFGASTKLQSQEDSDPLYKALALQLNDFTKESAWKVVEGLNASDFSAFMQSATHIRGKDLELDAGLEEILKEKTLQQKKLMTKYGQGFGRYSGFVPNFADPSYILETLKRIREGTSGFSETEKAAFLSKFGAQKSNVSTAIQEFDLSKMKEDAIVAFISSLKAKGTKKASFKLGKNDSILKYGKFGLRFKSQGIMGYSDFDLLSRGFIPNFAGYADSVMQLEENISGNNAILDTTTGPYPFIRNSAQPNFAAAVADHGGEKKALQDSMSNQMAAGLIKSARGFVPNFVRPQVSESQLLKGLPAGTVFDATNRKYLENLNKILASLATDLTLTSTQINQLKNQAQVYARALDKASQTSNAATAVQSALKESTVKRLEAEKKQKLSTELTAAQKNTPTSPGSLAGFGQGANKFFSGSGAVALNLGLPLAAGLVEQAFVGNKPREELSFGQRFAGSAISNVSSLASTGATIGSIFGPVGTVIGGLTGATVALTKSFFDARSTFSDLEKVIENSIKKDKEAQQSLQQFLNVTEKIERGGLSQKDEFQAFKEQRRLFQQIPATARAGLALTSSTQEIRQQIENFGNQIDKTELARRTIPLGGADITRQQSDEAIKNLATLAGEDPVIKQIAEQLANRDKAASLLQKQGSGSLESLLKTSETFNKLTTKEQTSFAKSLRSGFRGSVGRGGAFGTINRRALQNQLDITQEIQTQAENRKPEQESLLKAYFNINETVANQINLANQAIEQENFTAKLSNSYKTFQESILQNILDPLDVIAEQGLRNKQILQTEFDNANKKALLNLNKTFIENVSGNEAVSQSPAVLSQLKEFSLNPEGASLTELQNFLKTNQNIFPEKDALKLQGLLSEFQRDSSDREKNLNREKDNIDSTTTQNVLREQINLFEKQILADRNNLENKKLNTLNKEQSLARIRTAKEEMFLGYEPNFYGLGMQQKSQKRMEIMGNQVRRDIDLFTKTQIQSAEGAGGVIGAEAIRFETERKRLETVYGEGSEQFNKEIEKLNQAPLAKSVKVENIEDINKLVDDQKTYVASLNQNDVEYAKAKNALTELEKIQSNIVIKSEEELALLKERNAQEAKRIRDAQSFRVGVQSAFDQIREETDTFENRLGKTSVLAFRDGLTGAIDAAINRTDDLGSALMDVASGFLRTIQSAFNQQIANNLMLGFGSVMPGFTGVKLGAQRGGIIRAQDGIYVPSAAGGNGMAIQNFGRTGDVNPALLEDGEYVLNRNAVAAMGGPNILDEINFGRFPRFANGGQNTGSLSAGMNMGEPFAQLSEFGKEQSPEYRAYVDRLREAYQKEQEKKAKRKAFINQLIMTGVSAGISMGLGSISKIALSGVNKTGNYDPSISSTQILQARNAGVTINESGIPNMHTGGLMRFASGGYLPYGNRLNDTIPALLSGGEYIVNSRAVRRYGVGGLNRINSGVARFEDGGLVGDSGTNINSNTAQSSAPNNFSINITVNANNNTETNEQGTSTNEELQDRNARLGQKIKEVCLQVITNEQRSGGLLDSTKKK